MLGILENVKELLEDSEAGVSDTQHIVTLLRAVGDRADYYVSEASDYGSLARRKRLNIVFTQIEKPEGMSHKDLDEFHAAVSRFVSQVLYCMQIGQGKAAGFLNLISQKTRALSL